MKKLNSLLFRLLPLLFIIVCIASGCNSSGNDKAVQAENDIDAARHFIRAALDGDYSKGKSMLVVDSTNYQYYAEYEKSHSNLSAEEKKKYNIASIHVHGVSPINDSTTIIIFSNSYKNDHDTLKLLKKSGTWLVDLKYLFNHDMDSIQLLLNQKDSLK